MKCSACGQESFESRYSSDETHQEKRILKKPDRRAVSQVFPERNNCKDNAKVACSLVTSIRHEVWGENHAQG